MGVFAYDEFHVLLDVFGIALDSLLQWQ